MKASLFFVTVLFQRSMGDDRQCFQAIDGANTETQALAQMRREFKEFADSVGSYSPTYQWSGRPDPEGDRYYITAVYAFRPEWPLELDSAMVEFADRLQQYYNNTGAAGDFEITGASTPENPFLT